MLLRRFDSQLSRPCLFIFLCIALSSAPPVGAQNLRALSDSIGIGHFPLALSGDGARVFYLRNGVSSYGDTESVSLLLREVGSRVPVTLLEGMPFNYILADRAGSRLVLGIHAASPGDASSRIFLLDVSSRRLTELLSDSVSAAFSAGQVAFDDRQGCVFVSSLGGQRTGLLAISLETGEIWTLLSEAGAANLAVDVSDGFLYYTVGLRIFRLRPQDPQPQMIHRLNHNSSISKLYVRPGGGTLAIRTSDQAVFLHETATGSTQRILTAGRSRLVDVSRDGSRLLVESDANLAGRNADGSRELFLCAPDGRSCIQLTSIATPGLVVAGLLVNPDQPLGLLNDDGSLAVLASRAELPEPVAGAAAVVSNLYFVDISANRFRLLDSARVPVGADSPRSLSDGTHVAYLSRSGAARQWRFMVARMDGSQVVQTGPDAGPALYVAYSGDASTIAFVQSREEGDAVIQRLMVHRAVDGSTRHYAELNLGPPCRLPNLSFCYFPPQIYDLDLDLEGATLIANSAVGLRPQDPPQPGYIYRVQLHSPNPQLQLLTDGVSARISGDGRTLAWRARLHSFAGKLGDAGLSEVVDLGEGSLLALSQDGRYAVLKDSGQAVLASTDGSARTVLTSLNPDERSLESGQISAGGDRIAVLTRARLGYPEQVLQLLDRAGNLVSGFQFPIEAEAYSWSLSPQAERVYFTSASSIFGLNQDRSLDLFVLEFGPTSTSIPGLPDPGQSLVGLALTNCEARPVTVELEWLNEGEPESGPSRVVQQLEPGGQRTALASELFPAARAGTLRVSSDGQVAAYSVSGSLSTQDREGIAASATLSRSWLFPLFSRLQTGQGQEDLDVSLLLFNPNQEPAAAEARLSSFLSPSSRRYLIPPQGSVRVDALADLTRLGSRFPIDQGLLEVSSSLPIQARMELQSSRGGVFRANLPGLETSQADDELIFPFAVAGSGLDSWVWILNPGSLSASFKIEARNGNGELASQPFMGRIQGRSVLAIAVADLAPQGPFSGSLRLTSLEGIRLGGTLIGVNARAESFFAYSPVRPLARSLVAPFVAETEELFTSFAVANPYAVPIRYQVRIFDASGEVRKSEAGWLPPYGQTAQLLSGILQERQVGGYFRLTADLPVSLLGLLGSRRGEFLAHLSP